MKGLLTGFGVFMLLNRGISAMVGTVDKAVGSNLILADAYKQSKERAEELNIELARSAVWYVTLWQDLKNFAAGLFIASDGQQILNEAQQQGVISADDLGRATKGLFLAQQQANQEAAGLKSTITEAQQAEIDFANELLYHATPAIEDQRQKLADARDAAAAFGGAMADLKLQMQLTTEFKKQDKAAESLQLQIDEVSGTLTELGVQGYVSDDQLSQIEDMRSAWYNAWTQYNTLKDDLDEGLKPRAAAEAKVEMDALLDVIGGLQVEAAGMGMPELFSAGWTDNVEDAQAQYDELIQKQKDLAQASEDATNQIIVDSI